MERGGGRGTGLASMQDVVPTASVHKFCTRLGLGPACRSRRHVGKVGGRSMQFRRHVRGRSKLVEGVDGL